MDLFLKLCTDIVKELTEDLPIEQNLEYCEDCGDPVDKCSGYKCWIR
tara:strand:+ start:1824 stop:1964 length:141 start_codon:yes stop_codon:yes gene_type:complete